MTKIDHRMAQQMFDAHRTDRLGLYLRNVWERRSYISYVASSDLRSRQINTVLGNVWHLLNPILQILVYFLVFKVVLETDRGVDNFILFVTIGVLFFRYSQACTVAGSKSIIRSQGLIRTVRFPRAVLPVTSVVSETMAMAPNILVIYAVALATGESPRWQWVLVLPVITVLALFSLGTALVAARLATHLRDVTQIIPFVYRLLFYGSGVIFNVSSYASGPNEIWFVLNPLYCALTIGRGVVMGTEITGAQTLSLGIWTSVLLIGGFLWFRAAEDQYAR